MSKIYQITKDGKIIFAEPSKTSKKKQKLVNGGLPTVDFDPNNLTEEQKAFLLKNPGMEAELMDMMKSQGDASNQTINTPQKSTTNTATQQQTIAAGTSLINEILPESTQEGGGGIGIPSIVESVLTVSETLAGEQDENKVYDSDIQALFGQSSSFSFLEDALDMFKSDAEGSNLAGVIDILAPGVGGIATNALRDDEAKKASKEKKFNDANLAAIGKNKFAHGGLNTDDDPKKKKIQEQAPLVKIPIGRNPKTGDQIYKEVPDPSWMKAQVTPREWRTQTPTNSKQIAEQVYGVSQKDFNLGYKENPEKFLNELIKMQVNESQEGKFNSDDVYDVTKDSIGRWTLKRGIIDERKTQELTDGGEIKGAGTGKSDSIAATIPQGAFILPADANPDATKMISNYMGYGEADVKGGAGTEVKVSDGELYIPPEDVAEAHAFAKSLGYKKGLNSLAPKAEHKLNEGQGFANGLSDFAGTAAGAAQILYGLSTSVRNEEPQTNTPALLANLSREVRERAMVGLSPYERTQAEQAINASLNAEKTVIREMGGGDTAFIMANMAGASSRATKAKLGIEVASEKIKNQKELYADDIFMKYIDAEDQKFNLEYQKYIKNEEVAAELIGSGISNIVGQSQSNKFSESLEKSDMSYAERIMFDNAADEKKNERKVRRSEASENFKDIFRRPVPGPDVQDPDDALENNSKYDYIINSNQSKTKLPEILRS